MLGTSVGITEPEESRRRGVNVYNTYLEMHHQTLPSLSPNTCTLYVHVFYMIKYDSSIYKDFPGRGRHSSSEINESGAELMEEQGR